MTPDEIRLRCIEAAARNPVPHVDGYAAGVVDAAAKYERFVVGQGVADKVRSTLGLPGKK